MPALPAILQHGYPPMAGLKQQESLTCCWPRRVAAGRAPAAAGTALGRGGSGGERRPADRTPALDPGLAGAGGATARGRGAGGHPALLTPAPRRQPADRLVAILAGIARSAPHPTLRAIGAELARLRERTPPAGCTGPPLGRVPAIAGPQGGLVPPEGRGLSHGSFSGRGTSQSAGAPATAVRDRHRPPSLGHFVLLGR
jgi:hypothetical protein